MSGVVGLSAITGQTQMRLIDPAAPSEIMLLTNLSGTAGTVTRGVEGTTPVAHAANFTVQSVATGASLAYLAATMAYNRGMLATNNPQGPTGNGARYTTTGGMILIHLDIFKDTSISTLKMQINNGQVSGTANENFIGIYASDGSLLWTSADMTTAFASSNSVLTVSPSVRTIKVSEGFFYVAVLQNNSSGSVVNFYNVGESSYLFGLPAYHFALAGPYTTLPATINPASATQNNLNGQAPWVVVF